MMRQHKRPFEKGWGSSTMTFEGIRGVCEYANVTEMRAAHAAIRAKFAEVRPPAPRPAEPAKPAGSHAGHRQPVPDDKALARAVDRLASATQGFAAAISRHVEAIALQAQAVVEPEPPRMPLMPIWKIQNVVARHYNVTHNDL